MARGERSRRSTAAKRCAECDSTEHRTAQCPFAVADERIYSIVAGDGDPIVELRNRREHARGLDILDIFAEAGKWRGE